VKKMSKSEIARLDARMAELDKYLNDPDLVLTRGPTGKLQFRSKSDTAQDPSEETPRARAAATPPASKAEMPSTKSMLPPVSDVSGKYRPSWGGSMKPVPSTSTAAPANKRRPGMAESLSNYAGDMAKGFGEGMASGVSLLFGKGKPKARAPRTSGGAMTESGPRAVFRGRSYPQQEPAGLSAPAAMPRLGSSSTPRLGSPPPRLAAPKPAKVKEKKASIYAPKADVIGKRKPRASATLSRPTARQGRDISSVSTGARQDTIRSTTRKRKYKPGTSKKAQRVRSAVEAHRQKLVTPDEAMAMMQGLRYGGEVRRQKRK